MSKKDVAIRKSLSRFSGPRWSERRSMTKSKLWLTTVIGTLFIIAAAAQDTAALSTNSAADYLVKARGLCESKNFAECLKAYEQAAQLDPANLEAVSGQFFSLVELKRGDDGEKVLDKWAAAEPDNPGRWRVMAFLAAQANRPEGALKGFEKLTELQPGDGSNWVGKGEMLEALKRDEEALRSYDQAIALAPKHEAAWSDRGNVLLRLGKYDEAIPSYDKAIELSPKWADPFYGRACAYARKGDKTNALADLKRAIEFVVDPSVSGSSTAKSRLKTRARNDENFRSLVDEPDFKKLTE